jgi:hypothetical protein
MYDVIVHCTGMCQMCKILHDLQGYCTEMLKMCRMGRVVIVQGCS